MLICVIVLTICLATSAALATSPDAFRVLTADDAADPGELLVQYLNGQAKIHFAERRAAVEQITTLEALRERQQVIRDTLLKINGPFPEKTPLNARVTGQIDCDGYTIEKVIYESRPGHHVTANFYLPAERDGPVPGVLVPCGHSRLGKAYPSYQQICISLAQNGMAALIYDPIGQGERRQVLDDDGQPQIGPANEHTAHGIGGWLVGLGTANSMMWTGIRGIDYMISREEIDADKIGCTGNSGGGTLTAYLMAVDERIGAAAPSCWMTTQEKMFEMMGPQDTEQNFPGQTALGIEHADFLTLRAPLPALMCVATFDEFDIHGSWECYAEAKRFYGLLEYGHRLDIFEYPDQHGFSKPRRQAAMRFMRRWLLGKDDNPPEREMELRDEAELNCTSSGQVRAELGGVSVHDLNHQRGEQLAGQRADLWSQSKEVALAEVRRLAGIQLPIKRPTATSHDLIPTEEQVLFGYGTDPSSGVAHSAAQTGKLYTIETLILRREDEFPVPALLLVPMDDDLQKRGAVIHVSDLGKPLDMSGEDVGRLAELTRYVTAGKIVLSLDVRGFGETAATADDWTRVYFGTDYVTAMLAINVNRPLLGQRVEDLLGAVEYLTSRRDVDATDVQLIAEGAAGPPALHATALDERIAKLTLIRSITSWLDVVTTPLGKNQLTNVVPFALEYYDLPNLVEVIPPRMVEVVDPVDPTGRVK
jgi:cephalosporin-C deacetylase-like acetyl esterase